MSSAVFDFSVAETIQTEFASLWASKQRGATVEVTMPYLMPDSTLFSLYLTERDGRFIACEGGDVWEVVVRMADVLDGTELTQLRALASAHGLKEGDRAGLPIFFKECREPHLIASISFDVANWAVMAAHVVIAVRQFTTAR